MVCRDEVVDWFHKLSGSGRLDILCTLLDMCLPFEIRFVGTYVENLGRRDFHELRDAEHRANNFLHARPGVTDKMALCSVLMDTPLLASPCSNINSSLHLPYTGPPQSAVYNNIAHSQATTPEATSRPSLPGSGNPQHSDKMRISGSTHQQQSDGQFGRESGDGKGLALNLPVNNPGNIVTAGGENKDDKTSEKSLLLDDIIRRRLILYLSLLTATNRECANVYYKVLTEIQPLLEVTDGMDETLLEELATLATLAGNHPAFTFDQRSTLNDYGIKFRNQLNKFETPKVAVYTQTNQPVLATPVQGGNYYIHYVPHPHPLQTMQWQNVASNAGNILGTNGIVGDDTNRCLQPSPVTFALHPQPYHPYPMFMQNTPLHHARQSQTPNYGTQVHQYSPVTVPVQQQQSNVSPQQQQAQMGMANHPSQQQLVQHSFQNQQQPQQSPFGSVAGHNIQLQQPPPPLIPPHAFAAPSMNGPVQNILPISSTGTNSGIPIHAQLPMPNLPPPPLMTSSLSHNNNTQYQNTAKAQTNSNNISQLSPQLSSSSSSLLSRNTSCVPAPSSLMGNPPSSNNNSSISTNNSSGSSNNNNSANISNMMMMTGTTTTSTSSLSSSNFSTQLNNVNDVNESGNEDEWDSTNSTGEDEEQYQSPLQSLTPSRSHSPTITTTTTTATTQSPNPPSSSSASSSSLSNQSHVIQSNNQNNQQCGAGQQQQQQKQYSHDNSSCSGSGNNTANSSITIVNNMISTAITPSSSSSSSTITTANNNNTTTTLHNSPSSQSVNSGRSVCSSATSISPPPRSQKNGSNSQKLSQNIQVQARILPKNAQDNESTVSMASLNNVLSSVPYSAVPVSFISSSSPSLLFSSPASSASSPSLINIVAATTGANVVTSVSSNNNTKHLHCVVSSNNLNGMKPLIMAIPSQSTSSSSSDRRSKSIANVTNHMNNCNLNNSSSINVTTSVSAASIPQSQPLIASPASLLSNNYPINSIAASASGTTSVVGGGGGREVNNQRPRQHQQSQQQQQQQQNQQQLIRRQNQPQGSNLMQPPPQQQQLNIHPTQQQPLMKTTNAMLNMPPQPNPFTFPFTIPQYPPPPTINPKGMNNVSLATPIPKQVTSQASSQQQHSSNQNGGKMMMSNNDFMTGGQPSASQIPQQQQQPNSHLVNGVKMLNNDNAVSSGLTTLNLINNSTSSAPPQPPTGRNRGVLLEVGGGQDVTPIGRFDATSFGLEELSITQSRPKLSCYNCGASSHTGPECKENTMEEMTKHPYRINFHAETSSQETKDAE